jgi:hypothetical protein
VAVRCFHLKYPDGYCVRPEFEILTSVTIQLFWDIIPCSPVEVQ